MKNSIKDRTKKVTISATANGLTAQAGMIPVVRFLQKHRFHEQLMSTLTLQRPANADWQLADASYLTISGIIAGAESLSAVKTVWSDAVLRKIDGWDSIPDDTTLSRIFKQSSSKEVKNLQEVNHQLRTQIWQKLEPMSKSSLGRRKSVWIDIDSTVKTVYGKQEGAAKGFNPTRKGALSYHPLLAFCAHTKEIIQGILRPGNVYTSHGTTEFVQQIQSKMPGKRLIVRGDSGFFSGELLDLLDENNNGYLIKVKLKNLDTVLEKQNWRMVRNKPGFQQCRFNYTCANWKRTRSFVAIRKEIPKEETDQLSFYDVPEYETFCYVESEGLTPWQAHKTYGKRATCETWIEESKNQMALGHIKTDTFLANAVIFQCAIMAYNIIRWLAALSDNRKLKQWETKTIRCFLIRVAGKLIHKARQWELKIPCNLLFQNQWESWITFST
jgi:hypothetical protein